MIEVITGLPALLRLEDDWRRLGGSFPTPLLQYEWFVTAAETLHDERALRCFVVATEGRVRAIAPMALVKRRTATWLEIIGASRLFEPTGVLFEDDSSLRELVKGLFDSGYPVLLSRVRAESSLPPMLESCSRLKRLSRVGRVRGSCHVEIRSDWNAFLASMNNKARAGLRARRRRAETTGTIVFDAYAPSEDTLQADLQRAFAIELASWKGRAGSALLQQERLRRFFVRYAERSNRLRTLRLFFLRIGDRAVAMRIAVEHAKRLWFLKTGYDERFASLSPGIQLTHDILKYAHDNGLEGCEFLGSDEEWQHTWRAETHDYCSIVSFPVSARGALSAIHTLVDFATRRFRVPMRRNAPA